MVEIDQTTVDNTIHCAKGGHAKEDAAQLAHMVRELRSIEVRLQNMVYEIQSIEMWERVEKKRSARAILKLQVQPELANFTDEWEGP